MAILIKLCWCLVHLISISSVASAADKELGEYLSSQCTTCHQLSGKSSGIPSIVGWEPATFIFVMTAYKKQELPNKAMQNVASTLSDEDIASLAAYFGSINPQTEK